MKRIILGTILGTVVAFAYGFVAWAALGIWQDKMKPVPASIDYKSLGANVAEDGAYFFPPVDMQKAAELHKTNPEAAKVADEEYERIHQQGPVGLVIIRKAGVPTMDGATFAASIGMDVVCAFLMSLFIAGTACPRWLGRWSFGLGIALFTAIVANASDLAWFKFPNNYIAYDMADLFCKWAIASAAIALVVVPSKSCPFTSKAAAAV